jgi:hypothetical protein
VSRTIKWVSGIALGLLAVGLLLLAVAPGLGGALVIVALITLGGVAFAVNAMARRSPGWTRVVNPGAARREYLAEVAAREHAHEPKPTEADEQEG